MQSHQLINQDSGDFDYFTPMEIVDAARQVMGGIDLDPASSRAANKRIRATTYYDKAMNGLSRKWHGRVWMNHPFSKGWKACTASCKRKTCTKRGFHVYEDVPSNLDWIAHLCKSYERGDTEASCNITFGSTSETWFQMLADHPQCLIAGRTNYYLPDGSMKKGNTKGSVVTYMGPHPTLFHKIFSQFGKVKF